MDYVVAAAIGYLLGSIPVALLVARRHGVDLRQVGDGNPGAWNALDHLGWGRAWPAFIGDGLKGTLAGIAGFLVASGAAETRVAYVAVAAAMVGHAFPVFARFRGGKAVMTFVGGAFALAPIAAALALAVCLLVTAASRRFAYGARAGVFGYPLAQLAFEPAVEVAGTGALMCIIGALFFARRSGPSTSATAAGPTTSA